MTRDLFSCSEIEKAPAILAERGAFSDTTDHTENGTDGSNCTPSDSQIKTIVYLFSARKGVLEVAQALLKRPCRRCDLEPICATNYAPNQLKWLKDAGLAYSERRVTLGRSKVKEWSLTACSRVLIIKALARYTQAQALT
jgi:hypothetical protein